MVPLLALTINSAAAAEVSPPAVVSPIVPPATASGAHTPGPLELHAALVASLAAAAQSRSPYPDVDDGLTVQQAYALQRRWAAKDERAVAGYKAGLTDRAAQQRFAAGDAVLGVLPRPGELHDNATLVIDADDAPMLELEIGYVLGQNVETPIAANDPLPIIAYTVAVVEVPNLAYAAPPPRLPDIIASNVAADRFIVGKPLQAAHIDFDALAVTLLRNGEKLAEGTGDHALGAQQIALRWLINGALAQGYTLRPGHLLITGALSGMTPGAPGQYEAQFGPLGTIRFSILQTQRKNVRLE